MLTTILLLSMILVFSSCRPKDLEGAFVDYKAGRYDQALVLAEKVTQQYPANSEGFYLLGVLYGKKDRVPEMVQAFDASLKIDATHKAVIEAEKQNYFAKKFNSGATGYNKFIGLADKESDAAKKVINNAIKDFSDANTIKKDYRALNLITQSNLLVGDMDAALKTLEVMTETFADSARTWIALGKFYYDKQDFKTALTNFKKATELDANNGDAFSFTAQCYDLLDMPEESVSYYKKAMELNSDDGALPFNYGLLLYKKAVKSDVSMDEKEKDFDEAIVYLTKAIELNPDFSSSYQLKGNAQLLLKRYEAARETLELGVERFPDDYQMWNDLAICYTWLNDKEKAEAATARADQLK